MEHIRSDVSEIKQELRDQRVEIATQGKELRAEITGVRAEMAALGKELRAEIAALAMAFEKFKGSQRVLLAIIIVLQLVATGGVAGAVARAFNLL
ncbi:MAG TPA: hypothetical protein VFS52_17975 [Steroidobacteraceae bacterium]|nr:hypothetical protein [Steroidobacteraceae bacterium]